MYEKKSADRGLSPHNPDFRRFLGIAYGIYMHVSGFRFWYPPIMSMTIFGGKRPTPKYVQFLGDMLPGAVFSMLVQMVF